MQFTRVFGFYFLLFSLSSSAGESYIAVTKTKHKSQLSGIYKKFQKMHLKMSYKRKGDYYIVYSGPYHSTQGESSSLHRLKRDFPSARGFQNERRVYNTRNSKKTTQKSSSYTYSSHRTDNSGFYMGATAGYASALMSHTIEAGTPIIMEPKSDGLTYSLNGGYDFNNGLSIATTYSVLNTDDLVFNNIYGELNYKFYNRSDFTPYVGALVGFSQLEWMTEPILNTSSDSTTRSSSPLYGTQMGLDYAITSSFYMNLNYNCLFMNHVTNITETVNKSTIKHSSLHTIASGIKYKF